MPQPDNVVLENAITGPVLDSLFETNWRRRPALPLPGIEPARQSALFLHRFRKLLADPRTVTCHLANDEDRPAVSCWTPLPWDSQMYGFAAGRLDGAWVRHEPDLVPVLRLAVASAREHGIRHLIARVDAGDLAQSAALTGMGFALIDGIQTFSLPLPPPVLPETPAGVEMRLFQPSDLGQVLNLARTAYRFDRFHADSAIEMETADRINEEWLRNSCAGQAADAVVVAVESDNVLGYATCKLDTECRPYLGHSVGTIVMVATSESARRRGVAAACTRAAVDWFQHMDAGLVQVGTQLRNIPAARLYERCGFLLSSNSLTWRLLL